MIDSLLSYTTSASSTSSNIKFDYQPHIQAHSVTMASQTASNQSQPPQSGESLEDTVESLKARTRALEEDSVIAALKSVPQWQDYITGFEGNRYSGLPKWNDIYPKDGTTGFSDKLLANAARRLIRVSLENSLKVGEKPTWEQKAIEDAEANTDRTASRATTGTRGTAASSK